jgi:methyl-accepting chemotaxis protein
MDLDDAVQAHAAWKIKLTGYLRKCDGSLNPAEVGAENRCALGQWLCGEGRQYASHPEYRIVVAEHARFHRAAGAIVERANRGQASAAESMLGADSDYGAASKSVVKAIAELKKKVAAAG